MKKIFFVLAILALGLTACNTNEIDTIETPEAVAASTDAPVCYFNLPASFDGDAATKAVTIGEETATTSFEASDRVDIVLVRTDNTSTIKAYSQNPSTYDYIPLTVTPNPTNPAMATLSGQLAFYYWDRTDFYNPIFVAFVPAPGDEVYLFYNMNDNYLEYFNYDNQNGKLEGRTDPNNDPNDYYWGARNHDYAMAKMKVRSATGNTTDGFTLELEQYDDNTKTYVSFQNLGSLFRQRLSFKDKDKQTVTPLPTLSGIVVEAENGYVVSAYKPWEDPANAYYLHYQLTFMDPELTSDGDIYFAMMFNDDYKSNALKMTAYAQDGNVYTVTKNAPTSGFDNGKYYHGNSQMDWKYQLLPVVVIGPYNNSYFMEDNNVVLRGSISDYYIYLNESNTTVTLGGNGIGKPADENSFLYYSKEQAAIILESDYTINCSRSDNAIWVQSDLKLSTTGGSHTLTLIVNNTAYKGVRKPGFAAATVSGADGFTATLTTDGQDNGDGTYTYVYTVVPALSYTRGGTTTVVTGNFEAQDGDVLTGTLSGNYQISIANGATVTLDGVTINGANYSGWAGLTCNGDATIVLADGSENMVKGCRYFPGIYVPKDKTLTIQGSTGKLNASSNGTGAGIGGGWIHSGDITSGNILIKGGIITATGGSETAGIGGGYAASGVNTCGTITITGGTVTAYGGENAAGIGGAASCGKISISGGTVTATGGLHGAGIGCRKDGSCTDGIEISGTANVTATGGENAAGIGSAYAQSRNSSCGDILIGGTATVKATGGEYAAGIGSGLGHDNSSQSICGTITIKGTVTSVIATKGNPAYDSIGKGTFYSTCGAVFIEDPSKVTVN